MRLSWPVRLCPKCHLRKQEETYKRRQEERKAETKLGMGPGGGFWSFEQAVAHLKEPLGAVWLDTLPF